MASCYISHVAKQHYAAQCAYEKENLPIKICRRCFICGMGKYI
ncbi:MAG: hypothetical protein RR349_03740 [Oscillospiraceae bacterium]